MKKLGLQALALGTGLTLFLFGLGWALARAGSETLSYALYWQAWALEVLAPCTTIGSMCEDESMGKALFYAGLPLGIVIYSAAAFGVLWFLQQRRGVAPAAAPKLPPSV